jgi:hypothetical protein
VLSDPNHPPWFDYLNNIWWGVQIMKFLFSPPSRGIWGFHGNKDSSHGLLGSDAV